MGAKARNRKVPKKVHVEGYTKWIFVDEDDVESAPPDTATGAGGLAVALLLIALVGGGLLMMRNSSASAQPSPSSAVSATGNNSEGAVSSTANPRSDLPEVSLAPGCKLADLELTVAEISKAIERGAPEFNRQTLVGFENCFRIYEGTAVKLKTTVDCQHVIAALDAGLAQAMTIETYSDKAWALRDAFDGLLNWCATDPACSAKARH